MHPLMRSFAQRAALAAGRRRGGCGSRKKGALPLAQQEVRAQMHALEELAQVRPHGPGFHEHRLERRHVWWCPHRWHRLQV